MQARRNRRGPTSSPHPALRAAAALAPAALALGALGLAGCRSTAPDAGVIPVASQRADRPRLRYLDGQLSSNDACAIRLDNRLNPRIPPVRVNGAPVGFC